MSNSNAVALKMPSSYVPLTEDEMMYIEGGAGIKRSTVATAIDLVVIIATAGNAIATIAGAKAFLRANKNKIVYQVGGKLVKQFGGKVSTVLITSAVDMALTLTEFSSIGGLIAAGIDYVDGNYNGYCFG